MRDRAAAERRGRSAETLAALWLMAKGYRILARHVRTPWGKVDLAAVKGRTLVIVKVKACPALEAGLEAIGLQQRDRIARAGLALMKRYPLNGAAVRLDLIVVRPWRPPIHVRNAWQAERIG